MPLFSRLFDRHSREDPNREENSPARKIETSLVNPTAQDRQDIVDILESMTERNIVSQTVALADVTIEHIQRLLAVNCPLNRIYRRDGHIVSFMACRWPPETGIVYIHYFGSLPDAGNQLQDINDLIQGATKMHLRGLSFHGWNDRLNRLLEKKYGFVHQHDLDQDMPVSANEFRSIPYYFLSLPRTMVVPASPVNPPPTTTPTETLLSNPELLDYLAQLIPQLVQRGCQLTAEQARILEQKLQHYYDRNRSLPSSSTLIDALINVTEPFLTSNMGVAQLLQKHHEHNRATARRILKELQNSTSEKPQVILEESDYQLVELITRPQLQAETAAMSHCVGDDTENGDHYANGIKNHDLEIFSFRQDGRPLLTIEYDVREHRIAQIKKVKDNHLYGNEVYFDSFLRMLRRLPNTVDRFGQRRTITAVNDLEGISLPDRSVLTKDGQILPLASLPKRISQVSRLQINQPQDLTDTELNIIAKLPGLKVNVTDFPVAWKQRVRHFAGTLVDINDVEYPVLETCPELQFHGEVVKLPSLQSCSKLSAHLAEDVFLPKLTQVEELLSIRHVKNLSLPNLEKARHIDATGILELHLPRLREVEILDAGSAHIVNLPALRIVSSFLRVNGDQQLDLTNLEQAFQIITSAPVLRLPHLFNMGKPGTGNHIQAPKAQVVDLPLLPAVTYLELSSATTVKAPQLRQIEELIIPKAVEADFSALAEVGHLQAPFWQVAVLPALVKAGVLELHWSASLNCPNLVKAGYITAIRAQSVQLPALVTIHDLIIPAATSLDLPVCTSLNTLGADQAKYLHAPQLITVRREVVLRSDATYEAPLLTDAKTEIKCLGLVEESRE